MCPGWFFYKIAGLSLCMLVLSSLLKAQQPGDFSAAELEFVLSGDSDEPMRVYLITNIEDSILLRGQSRPVRVDPKDTVLQHFVSRLHATVTDSASLGVGIAAPQVGLLRQIIWVQRFDKEGFPWEVFLNPRIAQSTDKKQPCREGLPVDSRPYGYNPNTRICGHD